MRATVWSGRNTVQVKNVPDPRILNSRDAIVKITSTTICGSDLHLYDGYVPTMRSGDILGHEFMGEVVEVGADVKNLAAAALMPASTALASSPTTPIPSCSGMTVSSRRRASKSSAATPCARRS